MGDHDDFTKIIFDGSNDFYQTFEAFTILGAESFIDHQRTEARPGPAGQWILGATALALLAGSWEMALG